MSDLNYLPNLTVTPIGPTDSNEDEPMASDLPNNLGPGLRQYPGMGSHPPITLQHAPADSSAGSYLRVERTHSSHAAIDLRRRSQANRLEGLPSRIGTEGLPPKAKIIDMGRPTDPDPFGAIIITRPWFYNNEKSKYRVYTLNPGIVKSWLGPPESQVSLLSSVVPNSGVPSSEIRLLYDVQDFRVKVPETMVLQATSRRGLAEMQWKESFSGNEFAVKTTIWNSTS